MSFTDAFKTVGITEKMSPVAAINATDLYICNDDPKASTATIITRANGLLKLMGVEKFFSHHVEADIVAKSLIEQAILKGDAFVLGEAMAYAEDKIASIRIKMPWLFRDQVIEAGSTEDATPTAPRTKGANNSKNRDVPAMVAKIVATGVNDRGEIVRQVAEELGIEYANAFYYVKKAEQAGKLTLTSVRGRKPAKKSTP